MKLTLLWALPFAAKFALARPAEGDSLFRFGTLESRAEANCLSTETGGNTLNGVCTSEPQAFRVFYTSSNCIGTKCSVKVPRCDTDAGQNMGYCMNSNDACQPREKTGGTPARPGNVVGSWCFEEGILCCDGQVGTKLNAELPSQFIDAILPIDDQSSDPNILYSDLPSDVPEQYSFLDSPDLPSDESVQYSLLDSSDNNFLLSDTFLPSDNNIAFQSDDTGFLSANAEVDASWFQT